MSMGCSHISGNAAERGGERKFCWSDRLKITQQRAERDVERGERGWQTLGWVHREMVDYASPRWQQCLVAPANAGAPSVSALRSSRRRGFTISRRCLTPRFNREHNAVWVPAFA